MCTDLPVMVLCMVQSANVDWALMTAQRLYNEWRARGAHGAQVLHSRLRDGGRGTACDSDVVVRITDVSPPVRDGTAPTIPGER